jgi:hypothetical protein
MRRILAYLLYSIAAGVWLAMPKAMAAILRWLA